MTMTDGHAGVPFFNTYFHENSTHLIFLYCCPDYLCCLEEAIHVGQATWANLGSNKEIQTFNFSKQSSVYSLHGYNFGSSTT